MRCQNCGKTAMLTLGSEKVPICLDCNLKLAQADAIRRDDMEREMNYLSDEMESIMGFSGSLPRYPERKAVHVHGATFNNIHVRDSAVGVINTGTLGTVDAAITAINSTGHQDLGKAVTALCEAVISDLSLDKAAKNALVEMLSMVATEAAVPEERRRSFAIAPCWMRSRAS